MPIFLSYPALGKSLQLYVSLFEMCKTEIKIPPRSKDWKCLFNEMGHEVGHSTDRQYVSAPGLPAGRLRDAEGSSLGALF